MKILINEIKIGERQRIDLGDPLNDLASIGDPEVGLINPITVEEVGLGEDFSKYKLLAGRRRLEWHIRSGKTEIEATIRGNLSELQRQKIELLEDIERKDRSWQEECLAFSKLHNLIRLEKQQQNLSWTVRAMARFTGQDKNNIHYGLEIAKFLKAEPKDEEMWSSRNFTDAMKLVIERNFKEANAELERRRQIWKQKEAAALEVTGGAVETEDYTIEEELPSTEFVNAMESPVPEADITEVKVKVYIHGLNMAFEDAVPGVHFMTGKAKSILVHCIDPLLLAGFRFNLGKALDEKGYCVCWNTSEQPTLANLFIYPKIVWNRIAMGNSEVRGPFVQNYTVGFVYSIGESKEVNTNPSGSVISCLPEGDELPYPVVEWTLKAIDKHGLAVLCPCNAPVLSVAMTGRTPIWFEADKTKFNEMVQSLKNYYLDNVPNCEIYLRKVDETGDWTSELLT